MNLSKGLIQILTLRCDEASYLSSKELDEPLGLAEKLAVRGHTLACRSCRRLRRQFQFLHSALRSKFANPEGTGPDADGLSLEARARIERAITLASTEGESPEGIR